MEPESHSGAPATAADIATVLSELRAFRVWVEMKFQQVEQRFAELERRFGEFDRRLAALERRFERLQEKLERLGRETGWRVTVLNVTVVAAIVGTGALT